MLKQKKMLYKKSWKQFRESGLLWFVNRLLHFFGYAIVYEFTDKGKIKEVYPARCKFRGFPEKPETKGFKNLTNYMKGNIKSLEKDLEV